MDITYIPSRIIALFGGQAHWSRTEAFAHSKDSSGIRHDLVDHLRGVAKLAEEFAKDLGGPKAAYYAGLWHDLGKFHPDFQGYITKAKAARRKSIPTE